MLNIINCLGLQIKQYPQCDLSWSSSVSPGKFQDSASADSFKIFTYSTFSIIFLSDLMQLKYSKNQSLLIGCIAMWVQTVIKNSSSCFDCVINMLRTDYSLQQSDPIPVIFSSPIPWMWRKLHNFIIYICLLIISGQLNKWDYKKTEEVQCMN
jgi:hypothetical protein